MKKKRTGNQPRIGISDTQVALIIPRGNTLFKQFLSPENLPLHHWKLSIQEGRLYIQKDLEAEAHPNKKGAAKGTYGKVTDSFTFVITRNNVQGLPKSLPLEPLK